MKTMKYLNEMQKELSDQLKKLKQVPLARRELIKKYMGPSSKLTYLGHPIPIARSVLQNKLRILDLPFDQQFKAFEKNWIESQTFEGKSLSIFWLESLPKEKILKNSKKILKWANQIDNWAHSDGLCAIFAYLFEKNQNEVLSVYKKWNSNKNPWLQRCSLVGLYFYSRFRKTQPTFKLSKQMITPHLQAPEYYVQKGVGWTLREMYNVYPVETIQFLNDNIAKITSIAWVAASEKLKSPVKLKLLKKRREVRVTAAKFKR